MKLQAVKCDSPSEKYDARGSKSDASTDEVDALADQVDARTDEVDAPGDEVHAPADEEDSFADEHDPTPHGGEGSCARTSTRSCTSGSSWDLPCSSTETGTGERGGRS
jgi:hypothetical protein